MLLPSSSSQHEARRSLPCEKPAEEMVQQPDARREVPSSKLSLNWNSKPNYDFTGLYGVPSTPFFSNKSPQEVDLLKFFNIPKPKIHKKFRDRNTAIDLKALHKEWHEKHRPSPPKTPLKNSSQVLIKPAFLWKPFNKTLHLE